ncbi:MAG: hypothetical protein ACOC83_10185, partial [Gemmatimonadota bacterium]
MEEQPGGGLAGLQAGKEPAELVGAGCGELGRELEEPEEEGSGPVWIVEIKEEASALNEEKRRFVEAARGAKIRLEGFVRRERTGEVAGSRSETRREPAIPQESVRAGPRAVEREEVDEQMVSLSGLAGVEQIGGQVVASGKERLRRTGGLGGLDGVGSDGYGTGEVAGGAKEGGDMDQEAREARRVVGCSVS